VPRLYRAGRLLTLAGPPLEDGALWVDGGRVVAVGPFAELRRAQPAAEVVDHGDGILLPPLVNAHTHLELTDYPGWRQAAEITDEPAGFVDWIRQVVTVKRQRSNDDYGRSLAEGARRLLACGTGAVGDILSCHEQLEHYHGVPLFGTVFLELLGVRPEQQQGLEAARQRLAAWHHPSLTAGYSPHSPYTVAPAYLRTIFSAALADARPLAIHLGESPAEVEFVRHGWGPIADELYPAAGWAEHRPGVRGRGPYDFLLHCAAPPLGSLLVHGVQLDREEVAAVAESGSVVVLCPRSNARLGVGKAPVAAYLGAGVPLALGTDSLASSDSLSLWDEIAFALDWFEGRLSPRRLLAMATCDGAEALGCGDRIGRLAAGRAAAFQVLRPAALPPLAEIDTWLCRHGCECPVVSLVLDGVERLNNDG